MKLEAENYICALDSVTWYNGLASTVLKWKDLTSDNDYSIPCPDNYCLSPLRVNGIYKYPPEEYYYDKAQLQVLWMMAVEMFGECGTSPRYGWILKENIEAFHKWILDITETWRGSDRYDGPIEYMAEHDMWMYDDDGNWCHTTNVKERRKRELKEEQNET